MLLTYRMSTCEQISVYADCGEQSNIANPKQHTGKSVPLTADWTQHPSDRKISFVIY